MKIGPSLPCAASAALMSTAALAQSSSNDPVIDQIVSRPLAVRAIRISKSSAAPTGSVIEARGPDGSARPSMTPAEPRRCPETSASGADDCTNVSGDPSTDDSSADDNSDDDGPNHDIEP